MKSLFLFFSLLIVFFLLLTFSCAREAMPLGGPKDTIPPKIIKSYPYAYQTNFNDNKIVIKFNEFFGLKNIQNEFFVSPPLPSMPKFTIKGKKLIVKLKQQLNDSTTYTFEFGNSIVDYTEGNVLKNFKLVFSTYNQIDSLLIKGQVIDAENGKPLENIYIMLYDKNSPDSIVYYDIPLYITLSDKNGQFQIEGLKKDCYKLVALNDLNRNFIYDGIENQIGFLDSLICVEAIVDTEQVFLKAGTVIYDSAKAKVIDTLKNDTSFRKTIVKYFPENLKIRVFVEHTRPQQIVATKRPYPYLCIIRFNYPLHENYYEIKPLKGNREDYIFYYNKQSDSLEIWIKNKRLTRLDTLNFVVSFLTPKKQGNVQKFDTISFFKPINEQTYFSIEALNNEIDPFDSLILVSNIYLLDYDSLKFHLSQVIDTSVFSPKNVSIKLIRTEPDEINIFVSQPLLARYKLWINNKLIDSQLIKFSLDLTQLTVQVPEQFVYLDTINIKLFYWLKRFYDYEEFHSLSESLVLTRQHLINYRRITWDSIILVFAKPVRQLEIEPKNLNWSLINSFTVSIKLDSPSDTVKLKLKILDFERLGAEPIYFVKEITLPYKWKPNKIKTVARLNRSRVIVIFEREPQGIFLINTIDPNVEGSKNSFVLKRDTLFIDFKSKKFKSLKVNKIIIGHIDFNKTNKVKLFDTVDAEIGVNPLLKKTIIFKPQKFNIKTVKDNPFELCVTSNFLPRKKYKFFIMPNSLKAIASISNDSVFTIDFSITENKAFGNLSIKFTDASLYFINSALIMELLDEKDEVVYKFFVDTNFIKLNNLKPGDYKLKIIFDKNRNRRWDTGNYLLRIQPEKTVIFSKKISIKANWEIEEIISLKTLEKM